MSNPGTITQTGTETQTGNGTTPDPAAAGTTAPAGTPGTPTDPPADEQGSKPEPWDRTLTSLPTDVADYIRELRGENKARRTEHEDTKTKLEQVLTALGLGEKTDDDPAVLAQQASTERDQATATAQEAVRELAIYKAAVAQGANPDALTDSRTFMASVTALDPADAEFGEQVSAAIKDALTKNAAYRTTAPTTGAGSADFTGGNAGGGEINAERFASMSSAEKVALYQSSPELYRRLAG